MSTRELHATPIAASLPARRRRRLGPAPRPRPAVEWMERAACIGRRAMFFPDRGESPDAALAICRSCTARQECLEYALTNNERFGIWGGLTESERRSRKRAALAAS